MYKHEGALGAAWGNPVQSLATECLYIPPANHKFCNGSNDKKPENGGRIVALLKSLHGVTTLSLQRPHPLFLEADTTTAAVAALHYVIFCVILVYIGTARGLAQ